MGVLPQGQTLTVLVQNQEGEFDLSLTDVLRVDPITNLISALDLEILRTNHLPSPQNALNYLFISISHVQVNCVFLALCLLGKFRCKIEIL